MHDPKENMLIYAAQEWVGGRGIFGGPPAPRYPYLMRIFEPGQHPTQSEAHIELIPGSQCEIYFDQPETGTLGCYVAEEMHVLLKDSGWTEVNGLQGEKKFGQENDLKSPQELYFVVGGHKLHPNTPR